MRLWAEKEERLLDARGRVGCEGELVRVFGLVEVEERGRSTDARGVDAASEKVTDFRRAGGKKPRARRGMRAICVGCLSLGRRTQESCVQGCSEAALEETTELVSVLFCFGVAHPLGKPAASGFLSELLAYSPKSRSSSGRASGPCTGRPLTPQASTGSTIVFLERIVSLGHIRLALRSTACSQLYFMQTPASVSCFLTWCT